MDINVETINTFFESTCDIVVFAYLLTRGPLIALFSQKSIPVRQTIALCGIFGLTGMLELYFARDRFPYDTYTLIVTFATLRSGWRIGLITAAIVGCGALCFQEPQVVERTLLSLLICVASGALTRRLFPPLSEEKRSWGALFASSTLATVLSEIGAILVRLYLAGPLASAPFDLSIALLRIAANVFGVLLLQIIVIDAQRHVRAERFRVEAERNRTLLSEAQLATLRARVHPHFLFNALNTIASLCRIQPRDAEAAVVQLGAIMRRSLEVEVHTAVPLSEEIGYVVSYLKIEKLRFGNRLEVIWEVDPEFASTTLVPVFALQTLIENAILHGVSPSTRPGIVRIVARKNEQHALLAVIDNGVGIDRIAKRREPDAESSPPERLHGLQIVAQQLTLLYNGAACLRQFSCLDRGTCTVLVLPVSATPAINARDRRSSDEHGLPDREKVTLT